MRRARARFDANICSAGGSIANERECFFLYGTRIGAALFSSLNGRDDGAA